MRRVRDLVAAVTPLSSGRCRPGPAPSAAAALAALLLVAPGCSETEFGPDPDQSAEITFVFEVPGGGQASGSAAANPSVARSVTVSESEPSLVVDSVDVAIRELQLGREGTTCEFGVVGTGGDGGDGSDCEEASIRTVLQALPVNAPDGREEVLSGLVEPGTFDRLAFRLNVLEGQVQEEFAIIQDRDDMQDASVFVGGTYEGEEFELRLDPDTTAVAEAGSALTLDAQEQGTTVLVWDVASWFVDPDDGVVDPTAVAADSALEQQVEDRILTTVEARMTQ